MANGKTADIKKTINNSLVTAGNVFHKFQTIIIALIALVVIGYTIFNISSLLNPELNEEVYNEQLETIQPITFDQEAIEAIRNLEDPAEPVQTNLPNNRNNPF